MLLTTVGLAVGLIVGGVVLTVVLRLGLERAADDAIEQTAQEVAQLIDSRPAARSGAAGGTTLVQVLDEQGRVLAASPGADRLVAALPPDQLQPARAGPITLSGSAFGVLGSVRVVARSAEQWPDDQHGARRHSVIGHRRRRSGGAAVVDRRFRGAAGRAGRGCLAS